LILRIFLVDCGENYACTVRVVFSAFWR